MLVNPGLECVQLQRGQDGRWQVSHAHWLAKGDLVRRGLAAADRRSGRWRGRVGHGVLGGGGLPGPAVHRVRGASR